ncbi:CsbA family protein [Lederbergia wuyishanensis]|uniref:General stress protein CsbA n=1 Tax=Lederbergia wuyishanensis TaxID=1347903 RepID=A0ABU0D8J9_9BACI|nr:CsbA family protein [Lederbergia wuyishanensis]MCJ8007677.1 CsbA family protein [Lederbergia wuyishanensis]MDQ0344739.1 general stress protein CsbA [Lederbergia wuyishanensis]
MIDKIISAIFLPVLLMIFFTRVTYSRTVGFLLTIALIIVSAYKGYIQTWWLIVIEAASLTVGLYATNQLKSKKKNNTST